VLKRFFATIRSVTSALAAAIGWEREKDYVLRPWTPEEDADFAEFVASIGTIPSDPAWAKLMEVNEWGEFFNNDPWFDMDLPRA
jgi:hypothetical protein